MSRQNEKPRQLEAAEERHATNIGKIVLHLGRHHQPGDCGDCAVNNSIVNIIDCGGLASSFVREVARLSRESAAGIVAQISMPPLE